jgi:hypothetical protein
MKYANRDAYASAGQEANKQLQLDFSDGTSAIADLLPVGKRARHNFRMFGLLSKILATVLHSGS